MKSLVSKYSQIILVSTIFFLLVITKDKIALDDDVMNFFTTYFTSPVVEQKVKVNVKNRIFKDGIYKGISVDAYYGFLQVEALIKGGRISDITFLDYPSANLTSESINGYAASMLKSEALQIQDSNVDIISGASNSSRAFRKSLESALLLAI